MASGTHRARISQKGSKLGFRRDFGFPVTKSIDGPRKRMVAIARRSEREFRTCDKSLDRSAKGAWPNRGLATNGALVRMGSNGRLGTERGQ